MAAKPPRIYLSPPHMMGNEESLMLDALRSGWIAPLGPHVNGFEEDIKKYTGAQAALALSSGTAALHLALVVLDVEVGDEVWISTLNFIASANPGMYCNAKLVFFDSESLTWNVDPELITTELERRANSDEALPMPKAIVIADIFGQCADYEPLLAACNKHNVPIIEDACEALGATYNGRHSGLFGTLGTFSFNGNKIITCSGGGMLVASTDEGAALVERARFLSTQARDPAPHYEHSVVGYNYRLSNILAALGRGQLQVLNLKIARRKEIRALYEKRFQSIPGVKLMPISSKGESNYWLTCVTFDPSLFHATVDTVRIAMDEANIEARPIWKPLHLQPVFDGCSVIGGTVSEGIFDSGLCLPSGDKMTDDDVNRVSDIIQDIYNNATIEYLSIDEADKLDIKWPDIYFSPLYGRAAELCEPVSSGEWEVAVWGRGRIVYPYIKRPVDKELCEAAGVKKPVFDLVSPYGYSGIWSMSNVTKAEMSIFREMFSEKAVDRGYVAEFFRFSPLLTPDPPSMLSDVDVDQCGTTISVDLSRGYENAWKSAVGRHRTAVRKAIKCELTVDVSVCELNHVMAGSPFRQLYEGTMRSVDANKVYVFPDDYYVKLLSAFNHPNRQLLVSHVKKPDGTVMCAGLFMCFGDTVHYHLSGSAPDSRDGANNMMLDAVMQHVDGQNYSVFHLGGGVGGRKDALYKFKLAIGRVESPFYIGRSVLKSQLYDDLVTTHGKRTGKTEKSTYFPGYRG